MESAPNQAPPNPIPERQKDALLKLLADEDPAVYHPIRDTIVSQGPQVTDWLRSHCLSDDPLLRRRTREIVQYFARQDADNRFLAFCLSTGQEFDIEDAAWLLAQTEYPDINVEGYRALLDEFSQELKGRLHSSADSREVLLMVNSYLFDELGFTGNEQTYYDPENSYLNRVIDRRTGNPINLCLIYCLFARRMRLPVTGIGLPGHFICRYQTSAIELYIDAFNRGKLLTKADCIQYLLQGNWTLRQDYLAPVTARRMLLRICSNLHQIYIHLERIDDATRLQRYMVALAGQAQSQAIA